MRRTRNDAVTHKSTGSACLDFFIVAGSARRHPAQFINAFHKAANENREIAYRILLWSRDARGGAGERENFRNVLHQIAKKTPDDAITLISSGAIQELGRWDDVLSAVTDDTFDVIAASISKALDSGDRLAAKWLPRQGKIAKRFAAALGMDERAWRKKLVGISETVEQQMCKNDWGRIKYAHVPSVAAAKYQRTFMKRDSTRYHLYLDEVQSGRSKMNASVVLPHDIVKSAKISEDNDRAATVQWQQIPRPQLVGNALVVSDVSASMSKRISGSVSAMDVSVALGLLLSESLPEPFKNKVLTFSDTPTLWDVKGETLAERAHCLLKADWGGSTNFQATFDVILETVIKSGASAVPEYLVVLSDMEFNQAGKITNHAALQGKFSRHGLNMPKMVYWNLCGRLGNVPFAGKDLDAVMVSGFSPKIAEIVLGGNLAEFSPKAVMEAAIFDSRYDIPGLTVPQTKSPAP